MPTLNPLGLVKNVTGTATSLVRGAAELGLTVAGTVGEQVFRRIPGIAGDGPEPVDVVEEDDAPEPVDVVEEDDGAGARQRCRGARLGARPGRRRRRPEP